MEHREMINIKSTILDINLIQIYCFDVWSHELYPKLSKLYFQIVGCFVLCEKNAL